MSNLIVIIMRGNITFRCQSPGLFQGLLKVYFQFHLPDFSFQFTFLDKYQCWSFDFGSTRIMDFEYPDFFLILDEFDHIAKTQGLGFTLVTYSCFNSLTFFC